MLRTFVLLGAVNAFLAVALGAFGAHGLEGRISARYLEVYETGAHYHLIHALALVLVGLLSERLPEAAASQIRGAGRLFTAGIALFAGSLYLLAITGLRWLGMITPLGGICFLLGWALLAVAAARDNRSREEKGHPT